MSASLASVAGDSTIVVGLMSGTSLDGISAAVASFTTNAHGRPQATLLHFVQRDYTPAQRDRLVRNGVTARHRVSSLPGERPDDLRADLVAAARLALPVPGEAALSERQHRLLTEAERALARAVAMRDPLLVAEELRLARVAFDSLLGRTTTEDMLDALFGRFCIGK